MKEEELQQKFSCGTIETTYENGRIAVLSGQGSFALAGIYFFNLFMNAPDIYMKLYPLLGLVFCLYRIYRQHDVVCYVAEKGLVVRRNCHTIQELLAEQVRGTEHLVFIPYELIFSVSKTWADFELGQAEIGGIVVQPVRLRYLSKEAKQSIFERIQKGQEKDD